MKAVVAAAALLLLAGTAFGQPAVREAGAVRWLSGGITDEERAELILLLPDHNVRIVTAAAGSGAYLADVSLVVRTAGGAPVIETRLDGPWLLARLPPGRYQLTLTFGEVVQHRSLYVPAVGRREAYFYWPSVQVGGFVTHLLLDTVAPLHFYWRNSVVCTARPKPAASRGSRPQWPRWA